MLPLTSRQQFTVGSVLVLLLVATRGQHFATLHSLPGASWAVFFLAGVYLRPAWIFPALLAVVTAMDLTPWLMGEGQFCITTAYAFLLPAYGSLWLAGHWYAGHHRLALSTLLPLGLSMFLGAAACELFSSGGFYFFSGRFAEPNMMEFAGRLVKYFPSYLGSFAFYVGIAALVHAGFAASRRGHTAS
jgi:hypothetical protein